MVPGFPCLSSPLVLISQRLFFKLTASMKPVKPFFADALDELSCWRAKLPPCKVAIEACSSTHHWLGNW
ncbi:hypothetical protein LCM4579_22935 [Ensifer sp. LCM 4579]|nr:hypothetical protein LCM4579_22935 [Ensifer sp. LCM 4579]